MVLEADADVIGHINGGHTALPLEQIRELCEKSGRAIEIVHNGNERAALYALRTARELGQFHRVILGTDSPAGSGVQPLGILRMIALTIRPLPYPGCVLKPINVTTIVSAEKVSVCSCPSVSPSIV